MANFAVITNAIIKRVHCISPVKQSRELSTRRLLSPLVFFFRVLKSIPN